MFDSLVTILHYISNHNGKLVFAWSESHFHSVSNKYLNAILFVNGCSYILLKVF